MGLEHQYVPIWPISQYDNVLNSFLLQLRVLTGVANIVLEVLGHELSWRPDSHKLGSPRDHKTIAPAIYMNMRAFNCPLRLLSYFQPTLVLTIFIFLSYLGIFHDFLLCVLCLTFWCNQCVCDFNSCLGLLSYFYFGLNIFWFNVHGLIQQLYRTKACVMRLPHSSQKKVQQSDHDDHDDHININHQHPFFHHHQNVIISIHVYHQLCN